MKSDQKKGEPTTLRVFNFGGVPYAIPKKMNGTSFRIRTNVIAGLILLLLLGCVADAADSNGSISLVGLWVEEGATGHAITLRKSDGTYRRKVAQLYDYAQPPIRYREDGHWRINGTHYLFAADHISESRWRKDIGKQRSLKILSNDTKLFKYLSTDGAVVEERKISEGSDVMFDRFQVGGKLKNQKSK
jgi:hypothetical protein